MSRKAKITRARRKSPEILGIESPLLQAWFTARPYREPSTPIKIPPLPMRLRIRKKFEPMIGPFFFICKILAGLVSVSIIIVSLVKWYHSYESKKRLYVNFNHRCWIVDGNVGFNSYNDGRIVLEFRGGKLNTPYSQTYWFRTDSAEEMSKALKLEGVDESVCETDIVQ